jgi:hypothetical protein
MPSYRNITSGDLYLTDEIGQIIKIAKGNTATGCSGYFERYATGSNAVLVRTTAASYVPTVPAVRNENMVFVPGTTVGSSHVKTADGAVNSTTAGRLKRVILDPSTDTALRVIKTEYLGFNVSATKPTTASAYGVHIVVGSVADDGLYIVYLNEADGTKDCVVIGGKETDPGGIGAALAAVTLT